MAFTGTVGGIEVAKLFVGVEADTGRFDKKMRQVDSHLDKSGGRAKRFGSKVVAFGKSHGLAIGAIAVGTGVFAKKAIGAASDLDESINKANATFESSAKVVQKWSKDSAKNLGLSRAAALEGAASIGAMLKPMGVAAPKAAKMSMEMSKLAADMASFNNQDPTDMLTRIRAGLSGESEPLKQFGTVLSETRVKQFAYAQGIAETGKKLSETQKIQARYGLLLKDTKDQQGDFARTSDGLANQQRILKAQFENVSASLGRILLPAATKVMSFFVAFLTWIQGEWPKWSAVIEAGMDHARAATDSLLKWWDKNVAPTIDAIVKAATKFWAMFGADIERVLRFIVRTVGRQLQALKAIVDTVMALLRGDWGKAWDGIRRLFDLTVAQILDNFRTFGVTLLSVIRTAMSNLGAAMVGLTKKALVDPVVGIGQKLYDAGATVGGKMIDGIRAGLSAGNAMVGRAIAAVGNTFIRGVNKLIGAINFVLPGDPIPSIDQRLGWDSSKGAAGSFTFAARGMIARRPTLGVFGEAGPEALIPLSRSRAGTAVPLLETAAAAHGMALSRGRGLPSFGIGGIFSDIGSGIWSAIGKGGDALRGALPELPGGLMLGGVDILKRIGGAITKWAASWIQSQAASLLDFGVGRGGAGGLQHLIGGAWAFPVGVRRIGGGPAAHKSRALGNWQSDWAYDLMGNEGTPVFAATAGRITSVNSHIDPRPGFWGGSFYQNVPGGQLWYKHLRNIFVAAGDIVRAGQTVGLLGGSGVLNGGPHLHLAANPEGLLGNIPTLAGGGYVMRTGAAVVHRGETVGRGGDIHIHIAPGTGITREQARMLAREIQPALDRQARMTATAV